MTILQTEKEFEKILNEVTEDLFDANYRKRLYFKIHESVKSYSKEINQSNTFWSVISQSLEASSVFSLARAYDQMKDGINLKTFIEFKYGSFI